MDVDFVRCSHGKDCDGVWGLFACCLLAGHTNVDISHSTRPQAGTSLCVTGQWLFFPSKVHIPLHNDNAVVAVVVAAACVGHLVFVGHSG